MLIGCRENDHGEHDLGFRSLCSDSQARQPQSEWNVLGSSATAPCVALTTCIHAGVIHFLKAESNIC